MTYKELILLINNDPYFFEYSKIPAENMDLIDLNQDPDDVVTKGNACYIFRQLLKKYMNEDDSDNWEASFYLKDIYDCSHCIGHISQIFIKGILASDTDSLFGASRELSDTEIRDALNRIKNKDIRLDITRHPAYQKISDRSQRLPKYISLNEVYSRVKRGEKIKLIDVRSTTNNIPLSINISLKNIIINPYIASTDKSDIIVTYCDFGYQSTLAAIELLNHGYINVLVAKKDG